MSSDRGRLLANVRQRFHFTIDDGGELGIGPAIERLRGSEGAPLRRTVENLLWIAAAVFAIYNGDYRHHLFHVLFHDPRIRRIPFQLGLLCLAINAVIYTYLAVWLKLILKSEDIWELIAPAAIPTATLVGLTSSLLFSVALWPIWGFLTLPLLFTLFMAFVVISPYLPPYGHGDSDIRIGAGRSWNNPKAIGSALLTTPVTPCLNWEAFLHRKFEQLCLEAIHVMLRVCRLYLSPQLFVCGRHFYIEGYILGVSVTSAIVTYFSKTISDCLQIFFQTGALHMEVVACLVGLQTLLPCTNMRPFPRRLATFQGTISLLIPDSD